MAENSNISWTDHTFNPWWGCQRVSEGCRNCYAEAMSRRYGKDIWGPPATTERQITKGPWKDVRKWQRKAGETVGVMGAGGPQLVFCASMADIFENHPGVTEARSRVWDLIRECPDLHFLLLTKRPENIHRMLPDDWGDGYANVWLGTTVEDQRVAERAVILRSVPARVRFISYEPAIGPLKLNLDGIHWMIYGGESGPNFRPHSKDWARSMLADCREAGTAFFYKQSAGLKSKFDPTLGQKRYEEFPTI